MKEKFGTVFKTVLFGFGGFLSGGLTEWIIEKNFFLEPDLNRAIGLLVLGTLVGVIYGKNI